MVAASGCTLTIHQCWWGLANQSIALAKYLEVAPDLRADEWPAKRVIEVGAGCGLVGIALGLQGTHAPLAFAGSLLSSML